jgi:hypothetical protein
MYKKEESNLARRPAPAHSPCNQFHPSPGVPVSIPTCTRLKCLQSCRSGWPSCRQNPEARPTDRDSRQTAGGETGFPCSRGGTRQLYRPCQTRDRWYRRWAQRRPTIASRIENWQCSRTHTDCPVAPRTYPARISGSPPFGSAALSSGPTPLPTSLATGGRLSRCNGSAYGERRYSFRSSTSLHSISEGFSTTFCSSW